MYVGAFHLLDATIGMIREAVGWLQVFGSCEVGFLSLQFHSLQFRARLTSQLLNESIVAYRLAATLNFPKPLCSH